MFTLLHQVDGQELLLKGNTATQKYIEDYEKNKVWELWSADCRLAPVLPVPKGLDHECRLLCRVPPRHLRCGKCGVRNPPSHAFALRVPYVGQGERTGAHAPSPAGERRGGDGAGGARRCGGRGGGRGQRDPGGVGKCGG